jgi:phage tail protein X
MAISLADLKFFRSERMTEATDGGGRMSATEIVSGVENSVFDDVSDVDRAAGDASLRKVYAAVTSSDTAKYLDAGVIIFKAPTDPNSSVMLFSTRDFYDERADIRDYIESYLVKGVTWNANLYGNHLVGQQSISLLNFPKAKLPVVGQTLVLIEDEGLVTEKEQYVRIRRMEYYVQTFVDEKGEYTLTVINCELTEPLRFLFHGIEPSRLTTIGRTRIRDTIAASAARYYGIHPVVANAALGANKIRVSSLFSKLIPALQSETPLVDIAATTTTGVTVSGGARTTSLPQIAHTQQLEITVVNQQFSYVAQLLPKPASGTVSASYRALGKWYTLEDQGDGTLTGQGVGTINYATGSASITLSALPDVNSAILWSWGSGVHSTASSLTYAAIEFPGWSYQLLNQNIEPGSVTITWLSGGATKTAVDFNGLISGDAVGRINYSAGLLYLKPIALPDASTTPQVVYKQGAPVTESFTPALDGNRFVTITVADAPIKKGSVSVKWITRRLKTDSEKIVEMGV